MGGEEDDPRVSNCGLWGWRPSFLKVFNKPMVFLVMFSLSTFSVSITLGMNQIMLPTLQELFNMSSKQMGLILISNDISGLAVALVFGHFSSKGKMRWMFFGITVSLIANAMQAGTQLFVMLPEVDNVTTNGTTKNDMLCLPDAADILIPGTLSVVDKMFYAVHNNKLFWILFFAGILQGIGSTPQQVCGMTYLDEVMTQKKLGPALAFSSVIQYMGFTLPFLLTQYVTLDTPPEGVSPGSTYLASAWRMSYFAPGVLLALTGLPLVFFPTQMPGASEVVLKEKILREEATVEQKDLELNRSYLDLVKDILPTLKRLILNRTLWFLLFGEILSTMFLSSLFYDTKLLSLLLRIPVPETGMMIGILKTIGTVVGLAIGGAIVGIFNLSGCSRRMGYKEGCGIGKHCMGYVAIAQLITLPFSWIQMLYCNTDMVAGMYISYPTTEHWNNVRNLTNECNVMCDCSTGLYDPLCDLASNTTFYSPCYAGCESSFTNTNMEKIFQNCSCSGADSLVGGTCPIESSCTMKKWIIFIVNSLIGVMIYISCYPALHVAYLRAVTEIDRSALQGVRHCFTRVIGVVLGPRLFGGIINRYCAVWPEDGSPSGTCLLHDLPNTMLGFIMAQTGIRLIATLCFLQCWLMYPTKPPAYTKLEDEEKEDEEKEDEEKEDEEKEDEEPK